MSQGLQVCVKLVGKWGKNLNNQESNTPLIGREVNIISEKNGNGRHITKVME